MVTHSAHHCLLTPSASHDHKAGEPFPPEHWVNLFVRLLLYVLQQSDGFSPATQKVPRWEMNRS